MSYILSIQIIGIINKRLRGLKNGFFKKLEIVVYKHTSCKLTITYLFIYIFFYNDSKIYANLLLIILVCLDIIYKKLYNNGKEY